MSSLAVQDGLALPAITPARWITRRASCFPWPLSCWRQGRQLSILVSDAHCRARGDVAAKGRQECLGGDVFR